MPEGPTTATRIVTWKSSGFRVILNGKYDVVIIDIHDRTELYFTVHKQLSCELNIYYVVSCINRICCEQGRQSILGLASFYRRLVLTSPRWRNLWRNWLGKHHEFTWGSSQQEAFENFKTKLCTTPVLADPNFSLPFILITDSSKIAFAAILSQAQDVVERPIPYGSRQTNGAQKAHSASESEMLALV